MTGLSATITTPEAGVTPPAEEKTYTGPDYIPEKFRTADDPMKALAESYAELEKLKSAAPTAKTAEEEAAAQAAAEAAAANSGDPFAPFAAEMEKDGKLSEASYKTLLEKHGLSQTVVDSYIAGQAALADARGADLMSVANGKESYDAVMEWGATALSETERKAYDAALTAGDLPTAKALLTGYVARYTAEHGNDPQTSVSGTVNVTSKGGYNTAAELHRDQMDPRYGYDEAYRNEVQRKALASKF